MKIIDYKAHTIFVLLFCLFAVSAKGQNELDKVILKNLNIEVQIEELDSVIKQSLKDVVKLKRDIEKDSLENLKVSEMVKTLEFQTSKELHDSLKNDNIALQKQYKTLSDSVKALDSIISVQKQLIAAKESEINEMAAFERVLKEREVEADLRYICQRYSVVDIDSIRTLIKTTGVYSSLASFPIYKAKLECALQNKMLYDEGRRAIEGVYDKDNIYSIRDKLIPLLGIEEDNPAERLFKLSEEQFAEMDLLDISLSRYKGGISALKEIIETINTDKKIIKARESGDKNVIIETAASYLRPQEGTDAYEVYKRYFLLIPYLNGLAGKYMDEIEKSPLTSPTKTELEINKINVE